MAAATLAAVLLTTVMAPVAARAAVVAANTTRGRAAAAAVVAGTKAMVAVPHHWLGPRCASLPGAYNSRSGIPPAPQPTWRAAGALGVLGATPLAHTAFDAG